jgi:hypothetical protein
MKKEGTSQEDQKEEKQEKKKEEKKYTHPYAMDNLGPTVLRLLGYMPEGEGDKDVFIKPHREDLAYDTRPKQTDLNI